MNTNQRQALRLKILSKICDITNYMPNIRFYTEYLFKDEPDEIKEFIHGSLIYLYQEGYIIGTIAEDNTSLSFLTGTLTSKGIKTIEFIENNDLKRLEDFTEFSQESANIYLNMSNSNLIYDAQNILIEQNYGN